MKVIKSLLVVLAISLVCSSVSGNEKVVMPKKAEDAGFSLHITEDGVGWVFTPFINFCYTSDNAATKKKGSFTRITWETGILQLETNDGESAIFQRCGNWWNYRNYVDGKLSDERQMAAVGRKMAEYVEGLIQRYGYDLVCYMRTANSTINVYDENAVKKIHSECFNLPAGLECTLIEGGKVLLIWDRAGRLFSESTFIGKVKSPFPAIMAERHITDVKYGKASFSTPTRRYCIDDFEHPFKHLNQLFSRIQLESEKVTLQKTTARLPQQ